MGTRTVIGSTYTGGMRNRLYGHAEEGIEMTTLPKEKGSHKSEEKPATSESDIVDAE